MQIDRSRANRTAAGQRYVGFTETRDQRPEHENRRTHRFDQIIWGATLIYGVAVNFDIEFFIERCLSTHALQQGDRRRNVSQLRHVPDPDRFSRQQCSRENWQRRILCARNRDCALESRTAFYE